MMSFLVAVELDWEDGVPIPPQTPLEEVKIDARSPRAAVRKLLRGGRELGHEFQTLGPKLLELKTGQGLAIRVRRLA